MIDEFLENLGTDRIIDKWRYFLSALSKIKLPRHLSHLTPKDRLPSILKQGLRMRSNSERVGDDIGLNIEGIYLTADPEDLAMTELL